MVLRLRQHNIGYTADGFAKQQHDPITPNGVIDLSGSHDVIGHVTIRFPIRHLLFALSNSFSVRWNKTEIGPRNSHKEHEIQSAVQHWD